MEDRLKNMAALMLETDPDYLYLVDRLHELTKDVNTATDAADFITELHLTTIKNTKDFLDSLDYSSLFSKVTSAEQVADIAKKYLFNFIAYCSVKQVFEESSPEYTFSQSFALPNGHGAAEFLKLVYYDSKLNYVDSELNFSIRFNGSYLIDSARKTIPLKFSKSYADLQHEYLLTVTVSFTIYADSISGYESAPVRPHTKIQLSTPAFGGYIGLDWESPKILLKELTRAKIGSYLEETLPQCILEFNKHFLWSSGSPDLVL